MQPRDALPSHLLHDSVAAICSTSHSILDTCLNCPTGIQPFVPFASPLLRAHGDVLELDALCRTHVNISRQVAVSQCVAAPINHGAFTDAELPQASRRRPSLCSFGWIHCDVFAGDFKTGKQHSKLPSSA